MSALQRSGDTCHFRQSFDPMSDDFMSTKTTDLSPQCQSLGRAFFQAICFAMLCMALLPLAFWMGMLAFAIRVAIFTGHWPYYGHPDPKFIPGWFYTPLNNWLDVIVAIVFLCVVPTLFLIWIKRRFEWQRWIWISILVIPVGWLAAFGVGVLDPFGVIDWFMD